ncbi:MAG: hypothetical protein BWY99_02828 [Synergistetes bacterium ADurb.BinA166]|nr:MAG: hypothetical protein BWY99_02828 [Synergistetes bacterium ADurb.BinA166]
MTDSISLTVLSTAFSRDFRNWSKSNMNGMKEGNRSLSVTVYQERYEADWPEDRHMARKSDNPALDSSSTKWLSPLILYGRSG